MKPSAVYILGAPGVGKSTLMDSLLSDLDRLEAEPVGYGPMKVEPLLDRAGRFVGAHLGLRRESFSGTDALAMNVHPRALEWIADPDARFTSGEVYGEGQRLGTLAFLEALAERKTLTVLHLTALPETLDARCAVRGSKQSATWRKGALSRARNAAARAELAGLRVVEIDTEGGRMETASRARVALS